MTCDIHQWNGFDWIRQSWPWHWWMPSLHLECYYATNDSGVHFYFCSSVEASSPLKVLSFIDFYWDLFMNYWTHWNLWWMWTFIEWQLNWYEEVYNTGNKLLKCEWILSYHLLIQELSRDIRKHTVTLALTIRMLRGISILKMSLYCHFWDLIHTARYRDHEQYR